MQGGAFRAAVEGQWVVPSTPWYMAYLTHGFLAESMAYLPREKYPAPTNNTTTYSAGPNGLTRKLSGSGGYIAQPASQSEPQWTVFSYGIRRSTGPHSIVTMAESPGSTTCDRGLYIGTSNKVNCYIFDGAQKNAQSTATVPQDISTLVAAVADGSTLYAYCGNNVGTIAVSNAGHTGYTSPEFICGYGQGGSADGATNTLGSTWEAYYIVRVKAALRAPDIAALVDDPWLIFRPKFRPRYRFLAPASTGAMTATGSLTLGGTSTLTGTGALSASASLVFAGTSTLSGVGALASNATLVFGGTSTLSGLTSMTATASLTFGGTSTLTGSGALAGAAALNFGGVSTLTGVGALSATLPITFGGTSTLTNGSAGAMTATASLTFGGTSTLTAFGALAGTGTITFGGTSTLTNNTAGAMTATASLTFGGVSTLKGTGALSATAPITFGGVSTLGAIVNISSTSGIVFGATGMLSALGLQTALPPSERSIMTFVDEKLVFTMPKDSMFVQTDDGIRRLN